MNAKLPIIYNTFTWQERIVMFLVSMLFVLQPMPKVNHKEVIVALAIGGIWILLFQKRIYNQIGFWQMLTVICLLAIPGIISFLNTRSISQTTLFVLAIPLFLAAGTTIYSLLSNRKAVLVLASVIAVTSSFWIIDAIIQSIFGNDLFGVPMIYGKQLTGPFLGSTRMGILLTVTLPVTLKWFSRFGWVPQLLYISTLGYVLILTGVRTDLITFVVALVLFYLCYKKSRTIILVGLLPAMIIVGAIAISISPLAQEKLQRLISVPTTLDGWNAKLTNRVYIYAAGLNMGTDNLMTGVGAKAFNHAYVEYRLDVDKHIAPDENGKGGAFHAHHPWISVFAETGLTGIVFLIGMIVFLVVIALRSPWKLNLYHFPWLLSLVLLLNPVNSMLPLFEMWWFPMVLLVIVSHIVDVEYANSSQIISIRSIHCNDDKT